MLCSPLGPSSWKPWPSLGLHRARPADQRFNLPHPSFPTQAPKTQNENWWVALSAGQHIPEPLDKGLPPLRIGPSQKLLGLLPRHLEAVQGSADRLATAPQPEALASPMDKAAQRPARGWIGPNYGRRRGRALGGADHLAEFGSAVRAKKGTAAPSAAERERVRTLGIVGVHPAHHGVSPPARAHRYLRGTAVLGDVKQSKSPLAGAGMGCAQRQVPQVFRRLTPARIINS